MGISEMVVLDTHIWLWLVNANFDRFSMATELEYNAKLASVDGLFFQGQFKSEVRQGLTERKIPHRGYSSQEIYGGDG